MDHLYPSFITIGIGIRFNIFHNFFCSGMVFNLIYSIYTRFCIMFYVDRVTFLTSLFNDCKSFSAFSTINLNLLFSWFRVTPISFSWFLFVKSLMTLRDKNAMHFDFHVVNSTSFPTDRILLPKVPSIPSKTMLSGVLILSFLFGGTLVIDAVLSRLYLWVCICSSIRCVVFTLVISLMSCEITQKILKANNLTVYHI